MSINRVNITGNLTRDPEMRSTASGTQVLTLGVAVNDRRRNPASGEWEDYPNFVDCVMFGARAEAIARYLSKGTKVAIEGKLRYSSWDSNGQKRSKLEVIVDEIEFMSSRQGGGQPMNQAPMRQTQPMQQQPVQQQPVQQQPVAAQPAPQTYGNNAYAAPSNGGASNSVEFYDADIPF
jgi:single-strand DNA-binding protein